MLIQVATGDTSDEDGAGLSRRGMLLADKILLADGNEMNHLAFDEVPDPDYTDVSGTCMEDSCVTYK